MEELVGGKGEHVLPYAVRDYFDAIDRRVDVISSETIVEIENRTGDVVTLRRAIHDDLKDSKLVEIFAGPNLSENRSLINPRSTYLHDSGSARREEGFFTFLERFLGLQLPHVATTSGTEVKLYLQAIFAAHAVEQKRGWTDYIASIPFYGIRDAKTRVAEYILGLQIFETIVARNRLYAEAVALDQEWREVADGVRRAAGAVGVLLDGVTTQPDLSFSGSNIKLLKPSSANDVLLSDYLKEIVGEHALLRQQSDLGAGLSSGELVGKVELIEQQIQALSIQHDRATAGLAFQRTSLREYEELLREARSDLDRNKAAQKLQELGASQAIKLARGICPTCHQPVEDTLLRESASGPQMDLQTNIAYLESQSKMLERQIAGLNGDIKRSLVTIDGLTLRMISTMDQAAALRSDLGSSDSQSKAAIRRQVQIEIEVESLQQLETFTSEQASHLQSIAERLLANQKARRALPSKQYSKEDEERIDLFEKMFRANAGSFGYESVSSIAEIVISRDNLVPTLSQIELREILKKPPRADVKSDSSASDFVRLIWSYLLALYQTSAHTQTPGNHLGIILLDEPGQHSMRWESQRELLLRLAYEKSLQSIVAASFDESESVFKDVINNVSHQLISWEGKVIRPLV